MPRATYAAALLLIPTVLAAQSTESISRAAASITPEDVAHRIGVIAHDSMLGRNTPSPELDEVASYIANEFQRFGLTPGGDDGTFIQRYPLDRWLWDTEEPAIAVEGGPSWSLGTDVALLPFRTGAAEGGGPAVVLWGKVERGTPLGSFELAGKVAVIVLPVDESGRVRQHIRTVAAVDQQRPAAVVVVTNRSEESWAAVAAAVRRASVTRPGQERRASTRPPLVEVRRGAIEPTLRQHGFDLTAAWQSADQPVQAQALESLRLSVALRQGRGDDGSAPNVVGILEGSDPALKNEYIVYSGHMDHVGVGQAASGDSIFNGADDDASGTIAVVEAAEAFAQLNPRPKRSMIFLTVSGEERGMWGSAYFASNPPVAMGQIIANMNMDMVGRNWPDTIVVIGKEHSDLGETLNRVNVDHPELNMTAIDDLWPEQNFYSRSDHIQFARRGVPILFFFNGTHEDYHGVGDHPEKIDAEKESRIVKLLFYLGLEVANAAERPKWYQESYEKIVSDGR
jgi:hypothetical protein